MNKLNSICILISILILGCEAQNSSSKNELNKPFDSSYISNRNNFKTKLTKKRKAPQEYPIFDNSTSAKLINYNSNGLELKALLDTTNIVKNHRKPVVVYLHGGFALAYEDVEDCKPFIDAGYIVFAPTYRGENGNKGNFELLMGEVDDAKEAIKWISNQPFVDTNNIYVFGHSIGGAMSLLLTFHPNLPIKASASSAGLYDYFAIGYWSAEKILPFDDNNKQETLYRLPLYTLNNMTRNHTMYIGSEDGFESSNEEYQKLYPTGTKLKIKEAQGDHYTSLKESMNKFIEEVKKK